MPAEETDPRILERIVVRGQPIRVVARRVCMEIIKRLDQTLDPQFGFGDVSGWSLEKAFQETDDDDGRLEARIRAIEDRFIENLSPGTKYRRVTYAIHHHNSELHGKSKLWQLTEEMEEGVS